MSPVRDSNAHFLAEVERLRSQGVVGQSGRLRELFDYFVHRGVAGQPATQDEIAVAVFGQQSTDSDDATVRVYVHRLRKKIDDFYFANPPSMDAPALEIPAGIYALRLVEPEIRQPEAAGIVRINRTRAIGAGIGAIVLMMVLVAIGMFIANGRNAPGNAIWDPLEASERPILLVLGDYYMFGEVDPVRPEEGRLIRDFRVDSAEDLLSLQEADPERYGNAEDVGLTYLPLSTAYALNEIVPILQATGRDVRVVAASHLQADVLRDNDIVYLGLLSGLGLLEGPTFGGSMLRIGGSYDELTDTATNRNFISEEFRRLSSTVTYRDYGYIARFAGEGGGQIVVIAGARETALRAASAMAASQNPPAELSARAVDEGNFEALFQVTGQQGADLSTDLVFARSRMR